MLAIFVTVLIALLGLSASLGALSQKVKSNCRDIENNRKEAEKDIERLHIENRQDHKDIFSKLEAMDKYIRNSRKA
jgi:predicted Holliday junction resolvase-like endonuclease